MLTIFWEVEGYSGNTRLYTDDTKLAKRYFDIYFKPHGYILISIQRG